MHEFKVGQRYRFGSEDKGTVHEVVVFEGGDGWVRFRPELPCSDVLPFQGTRLMETGALTFLEPQVIELRMLRSTPYYGDHHTYNSPDFKSKARTMSGHRLITTVDAQELKVTIEVVR